MDIHEVQHRNELLESLVQKRTAELRAKNKELDRRNQQLEVVNTIVKIINDEVEFDALLMAILEGVAFAQGAERALAIVEDEVTGDLEIRASTGFTTGIPGTLHLELSEIEDEYLANSEEISHNVLRGKPAHSRLATDERAVAEPLSCLAVRIKDLGYLIFSNTKDPEAFDDVDLEQLVELQEHVASAYVKGRMLDEQMRLNAELKEKNEQLDERNARLEIVNSIVKIINSQNEFGELMQSILEGVAFVHGAERALALLHDRATDFLHLKGSSGWTEGAPTTAPMSVAEFETEYLSASEEIEEGVWRGVPGRSRLLDAELELEVSKTILVMRVKELGYLVFSNRRDPQAFDDTDLESFIDIREHVASAFVTGRMLDELVSLNQDKSQFLGIAAHDLRGPLSSVIGYAELLLKLLEEEHQDKEKWSRFLNNVCTAAKQMNALVGGLLDVAAIESGRVELEISRHRLTDILMQGVEGQSRKARDKGIEIQVGETCSQAEVLVDQVRIREVVDNLLSNAIKFTQHGGEIRIHCELRPHEIVAHFSDTGLGLHEREIGEVFTGRQLSAQPTAGEESTGLGLVIVKKLVELHRGRTWVKSEKDKGSTFSFSLPLAS